MKKPIASLLVMIVSTAILLTSCGGRNTGAANGPPAGAEDPAETEEKAEELNWLSYKLKTDEVREMDENYNLQIDPPPEGSRYIVVRLLSVDGDISAADITDQNTEQIVLKTASGEEYNACLSVIWGIGFDPSTGTFSTNELQEGFQLLYIVPENIKTEDMTVSVR